MSEAEVAKIADAADLIVGGYAMAKHELGVQIVNLHTGNALILSPEDQILETSMEDLEVAVSLDYLKTNRSFLEI